MVRWTLGPTRQLLGDDVGLPDDEDGLNHPSANLTFTHGMQPKVNMIVTNRTGVTAKLTGWIDYNADGVFSDLERAQVAVESTLGSDIATLTFPVVPAWVHRRDLCSVRLSTDVAAESPLARRWMAKWKTTLSPFPAERRDGQQLHEDRSPDERWPQPRRL